MQRSHVMLTVATETTDTVIAKDPVLPSEVALMVAHSVSSAVGCSTLTPAKLADCGNEGVGCQNCTVITTRRFSTWVTHNTRNKLVAKVRSAYAEFMAKV